MRARILVTFAGLSVAAACAPHQRPAELGPIVGSTPGLQPQLTTAVTRANGDVELTVRLPRTGYLTAISILPGQSVALLTLTPGAAAPDALTAGEHHLLLRPAPIFLAPNARAAAGREARSAAAQAETASRPAMWQTLVVVTEQPLDRPGAQAALADVDLRGSAQEVVGRIARAVGTGSAGQWAAVARVTRNMM